MAALPLALGALLAGNLTQGGGTTAIKTSSCCAAHGGCVMKDQILDFPASVQNPPEFDYKVTGTLPHSIATGTYVVTGKLAGVQVANKKGTACGAVTIVVREVIKLATITINFPPCPDEAGAMLVTGHVSVPIAPPLGTVFNTNVLINDPTGAAIACIEIDVGGGTAEPASVAATGCCPTGGCDLSPQNLNFPAVTPNPMAFDYTVTGSLPAGFSAGTAPQFSFVGKVSTGTLSFNIGEAKGAACGAQDVKLSYLSVDIGNVTIIFPACPYVAGAQSITGHVFTSIALPDSILFDGHIEVTDDNGKVGSCLNVHVAPNAPGPVPPGPPPPAPVPPTPTASYICSGGQCVAAAGGVPKNVCVAACG